MRYDNIGLAGNTDDCWQALFIIKGVFKMSHAIAVRQTERAFEVFCVDCRCSLGTMTGDTLSSALVSCTGRGGVKCPKCRENSCRGCGMQYERNKDGLCWFCNEEKAEEQKHRLTGEKVMKLKDPFTLV